MTASQSDIYDISNIPPLKAYLDRIGAEVLNHKRFMIKEHKGNYYTEKVLIKLADDGELIITGANSDAAQPTDIERELIKIAVAKIEFPKSILATNIIDLKPKLRAEAFVFLDRRSGLIRMVQERFENKVFIPWTLFSDGEWRAMEPDGNLPLWKPDRQTSSRIMIHEGAKSARNVQRMVDDPKSEHPWKEFLSLYCHWGMIGGALAPHRTDYKEIYTEQPTEVIYVCDNDFPGVSALKEVSKNYGRSMKGIKWDIEFKEGFDLADDLPAKMFNGKRFIGRDIVDYIVPATRATEIIPNPLGKGRSLTVMKRDFCQEWLHCVSPEVYVHKDWANRVYQADEFNSIVDPYSDVSDTSRLLKKDAASKSVLLKYVPHLPSGIGTSNSGHFINTHVPSSIKEEAGDATQWEKFIEYLVPDDNDRRELMRWCATLITKPENRMLYGVLMISEVQGIGKSTLGEKILAPLVGEDNWSTPQETEIVDGNFNAWLAHKRLAVVHEIYSGHSFKAYNRLKSVITDKTITVNKKFQSTYMIENWVHIFACSNSLRALKLAEDDRRWFVPKLTSEKRQNSEWQTFFDWLKYDGGLGIIKFWCKNFLKKNGAVMTGEDAPGSTMKKEVIEEGYSKGQMLVSQTLDILSDKVRAGELPDTTFLLDSELVEFIKNIVWDGRNNDHIEKPVTIRRLAKSKGWNVGNLRAHINGWGKRTYGSLVISWKPEIAEMSPGKLAEMGLKPSSLALGQIGQELVQM